MTSLSPILAHELNPANFASINAMDDEPLGWIDILRYPAAQPFERHANIEGAYFLQVVTGLVQVVRDLPHGQQAGLGIYGPDAYLFAMDRVTVLSKEASVMTWTQEEFERAVRRAEGPGVCIAFLAERLGAMTERQVAYSVYKVPQRLALVLLHLADAMGERDQDGAYTLPGITHHVLASEAGTTRAIATKFLNEFRQARAIRFNRKAITVRPDVLRRAAKLPKVEE